MYMGEEDLILVWIAVGWRRQRQDWSQAGMGARECLMSAFLCKAMPGARSGDVFTIAAQWKNSV